MLPREWQYIHPHSDWAPIPSLYTNREGRLSCITSFWPTFNSKLRHFLFRIYWKNKTTSALYRGSNYLHKITYYQRQSFHFCGCTRTSRYLKSRCDGGCQWWWRWCRGPACHTAWCYHSGEWCGRGVCKCFTTVPPHRDDDG